MPENNEAARYGFAPEDPLASVAIARAPVLVLVARGPELCVELVSDAMREVLGEGFSPGQPLREAAPCAPPALVLAIEQMASAPHIEGAEVVVPLGGWGGRAERFVSLLWRTLDLSPTALLVVGFDSTVSVLARRALERGALELEEAARLKDQFLATISHELRTPLTAILGWGRILQGGTIDSVTAQKGLASIVRNAEVQTKLVDDLIDVNRLIRGKVSLRLERLSVNDAVQAAVESVSPSATVKGVSFVVRPDPDDTAVAADPDRLQQIVWNILTNAVKFSTPGGQIEVALSHTHRHVVVEVIDHGRGIPREFLPHVFEPFRQIEDGASRAGLGLGLSIVKHLVELHGGAIAIESDGDGRGARVSVRLPIGAVFVPSEPRSSRTSGGLSGLRVLVVDDESSARELLAHVLGRGGAEVVVASSAAEALRAFEASMPDVVVSDIAMPGMDGHALVRALRALPVERGGRVPAVALTAHASPEARKQALWAGFQSHIPKPVEPDELLAAVASLSGRPLASAE